MTPREQRAHVVAGWRRDCLIAWSLMHAIHESMEQQMGDPRHMKSLRLMAERLSQMRTEMDGGR